MPMNKEVFDQYRKIVTYEIEARNLKLTGSIDAGGNTVIGGNLVVTGSISGSQFFGVPTIGVTSLTVSGSSSLTSDIVFTGSGDNTITQDGQVITISGSGVAAIVSSVAASGSDRKSVV